MTTPMFDATSIIGRTILRDDDIPCRGCGSLVLKFAKPIPPHVARLECANCRLWFKWLSAEKLAVILDTSNRYGWPNITVQSSQYELFADATVNTPADGGVTLNPQQNGQLVMPLGFNYSSGGDSNSIIPFLKYDARAGKLFRNDRKEVNGAYSNHPVEITTSFKAVVDMENIEVGFIHFAAGAAPGYALVKHGQPLPYKPEGWKQGMRIMLKLDAACGGDVREITSNAQAFLKGFDDLYDDYVEGKKKNPGKLPVVILRGTEPLTSGSGSTRSTNYQPCFEIVGWAARPADLVHVPKQTGDDDGDEFVPER
jgi:hypothetical protein